MTGVGYQGYFGEPYCSIGCQLIGGREASRALMDGLRGTCAVCGKAVEASPYVDRCSIVSDGNGFTFICTDCTDRGKAMVAARSSCSRCGAALA